MVFASWPKTLRNASVQPGDDLLWCEVLERQRGARSSDELRSLLQEALVRYASEFAGLSLRKRILRCIICIDTDCSLIANE